MVKKTCEWKKTYTWQFNAVKEHCHIYFHILVHLFICWLIKTRSCLFIQRQDKERKINWHRCHCLVLFIFIYYSWRPFRYSLTYLCIWIWNTYETDLNHFGLSVILVANLSQFSKIWFLTTNSIYVKESGQCEKEIGWIKWSNMWQQHIVHCT